MEEKPASNDESNIYFEKLKTWLGEDYLTFLNIYNSTLAIKQGCNSWRAPFSIGLYAIGHLHYKVITENPKIELPDIAAITANLSVQILKRSTPMTAELTESAYEAIEDLYKRITFKNNPTEANTRTLFYTRLAMGILLLLKGEEKRGTSIIYENITIDTIGEMQLFEALYAIILQAYYSSRQDYDFSFRLLREALSSNSPGYFSEGLLEVVPDLLESFTRKCECLNNTEDWVNLFDRASGIIEVCGSADVSGEQPSDCKTSSPQFLAWKFGHLIARYALRNSSSLQGNNVKIVPDSYHDKADSMKLFHYGLGEDWLNGTLVAATLLEFDQNRNWSVLREQYLSMWNSLPRYQWTSLCEAGPDKDLYWAVKIGFAETLINPNSVKLKIEHVDFEEIMNPKALGDIAESLSQKTIEEKLAEYIHQFTQQMTKFHTEFKAFEEETLQGKLDIGGQPTIAEIQQRLVADYGDWIQQLANPGALNNAEYLFIPLNRIKVSWGESILGYSNVVEAELKNRFVEPLRAFLLKSRGKNDIAFGQDIINVDKKNITLSQIEKILRHLRFDPLLKEFIAGHDVDLDFLSKRLPASINELRGFRGQSAHGNVVNSAERVRNIVLGTPQRPGILKSIFDINFKSNS